MITKEQVMTEMKYPFYYTSNRNDYESDVIFANFRPVTFTGNKIFRSASPCDNCRNRATYVDALCKKVGIKSIIDLADTEEELKDRFCDEGLDVPYWKALYKSGKVKAIGIKTDEDTDDFRERMTEAIKLVADAEKPLLIHCREGKDRTGFAALVIEVLGGADLNGITDDFMISYENYFGITRDKTPFSYGFCIENYFSCYLKEVFAGKELCRLTKNELSAGIEKYLEDSGMTKDEIFELKTVLCEYNKGIE